MRAFLLSLMVLVALRHVAEASYADELLKLDRGYDEFVAGDYGKAAGTLQGFAQGSTLRNVDHALYMLAQAEAMDGNCAPALVQFQRVIKMGGRFALRARARNADCLYTLGRKDEAKKEYTVLLSRNDDDIDLAVARFRLAEIAGVSRDAVTGYRAVWSHSPQHPLADVAMEKLRAMVGTFPDAASPTPDERLERAKLLIANRLWKVALAELGAIVGDMNASLRHDIDAAIGTAAFRERHSYPLAAEKLLGVWSQLPTEDRRAEALFHGARAQSRSDKDDAAIVGYHDVIAKFPKTKYAQEASFLIGWLQFNHGQYAAAIPALEDSLKRYPSTKFSPDARWYLGFSRYVGKDYAGAIADFEKLHAYGGALVAGKGQYWRARALLQLGRKEEAKKAFADVASAYPFSFYAQVARLRAKELGENIAPTFQSTNNLMTLSSITPQVTGDIAIKKADELLEAGLDAFAGDVLAQSERDLIRKYKAKNALPVLFARYQKAENFFRIHNLAEAYGGAALAADPRSDAEVRRWWQWAYPLAYQRFVEKYAPTGDNPTYYLYTIMQKESAYYPNDVSYADAIGLLQMIPPTSRRVALRIAYPYTDDVLYDPEGNIRFGAWYIGHLLKKFHGQIALGAGAFNAGPRAMMKWLKLYGDRPLDEFVEFCPFTQTREYMKKVLEIYARYVYLYAHTDYLPLLKVEPVALDDGIDY